MHITIIDDNADLLEVLSSGLAPRFQLATFLAAQAGLEFLRSHKTDAVVLDLHMPGDKNGFQIYDEIRKLNASLPVLFLTGDGALPLRVKGFEMGADDFIVKPVELDELAARIKNRVQLSKRTREGGKSIQYKDLVIDLDGHQVLLGNQPVKLTPKEYQLLVVLAQNPNKVIHKEDLITQLWKDVHVEVNNLDTHFSNLRRKLKPFSNHIKTLKNLGYVLRI